MTEEELIQLIENYKKNPEMRYCICWEIFSFLYFNPHFFMKQMFDDDIKNDFLVFFFPKIEKYITHYDASKGSARAFLYFYVHGYFMNFYHAYITTCKKQSICHEDISIHESKAAIEDAIFHPQLDGMIAMDSAQNSVFSTSKLKTLNKTKKRRLRLALLILAIKSCMVIEDKTIALISCYTKMNIQELTDKIETARSALSERIKRAEHMIQIRNTYYINKRLHSENPHNETKRAALRAVEKHLKTITGKIRSCSFCPTNRYIARLLGISFTTVNRYVAFLESNESTGFFDLLRDTIAS